MKTFRLPESKIDLFKELCYITFENLGDYPSSPLRGTALLDPFCQALGWSDYNLLRIDAKTYGNGSMDWKGLYECLMLNCPRILEIPAALFNRALFNASRKMAAEHQGIEFASILGIMGSRPYDRATDFLSTPEGLFLLDGHSVLDLQTEARATAKNSGSSYSEALLNVLAQKESHRAQQNLAYKTLFWPSSKTEVLRVYASGVLLTLDALDGSLFLNGCKLPVKPSRNRADMMQQVVYGDVTTLELATSADTGPNGGHINPGWWLCKYGLGEPGIDLTALSSAQVQWIEWYFAIGAGWNGLYMAPAFEQISAWCQLNPRIAMRSSSDYFPNWGPTALRRNMTSLI